MEKREPLCTVGGDINSLVTMEKLEVAQKIKYRTICCSNTISRYTAKGNKNKVSNVYLHSHVYCIIIHNRGINKEDVLFTYNGILFSLKKEGKKKERKKKTLPFETSWMSLEGIILSEISQTKTHIVYYLYMDSKTKPLATESRMVLTRG